MGAHPDITNTMKTLSDLIAISKTPEGPQQLQVMLAELDGMQTRYFRFSYPSHAAMNGGGNSWSCKFTTREAAEEDRARNMQWWPERVTPVEEFTCADVLPNYPADLNACREVALTLKTDAAKNTYINTLYDIATEEMGYCDRQPDADFLWLTASALQHTVALILTLQKHRDPQD